MQTNNTLSPFIERYLRSLETAGRSANTIGTYRGVLDTAAHSICEKYSVSGIEDVKGYMVEDAVQDMGNVSVSTRNYYISLIQLFFRYMVAAGFIDTDPSLVLQKTKVITDDAPIEGEIDSKAYSEKNLLSIIKACQGAFGNRDKAIVALLSGSGLRASELCSLTVGDWQNRTNGHIYVKRKGGAHRWVAVAEYVTSYIERYLSERQSAQAEDPLFVTRGDKPLVRQELYRILKRRQDAAKVKAGVHIFRHTFLTGTSKVSNVKVAQALANHSSSSTTKRYIHSTTDERREAVNGTSWAKTMEDLA